MLNLFLRAPDEAKARLAALGVVRRLLPGGAGAPQLCRSGPRRACVCAGAGRRPDFLERFRSRGRASRRVGAEYRVATGSARRKLRRGGGDCGANSMMRRSEGRHCACMGGALLQSRSRSASRGRRRDRAGQGHARPEAAAAARQARRSRKPRPRNCSAARPTPAPLEARVIGFYAKGCLAGAKALPINGQTWQVMRLSRNRNWGHPELVQFLERFAEKVPKVGWHGLLVGDMSQPRGGPMLTGHSSHQVGLDADIWLTPMPDRELTRAGARGDVGDQRWSRDDRKDVDPKIWTPAHIAIIKAAAEDRRSSASSSTRRSRRRSAARPATTAPGCTRCGPMWGHNYHFHIRIAARTAAGLQAAGPGAGGRRLRQGSRLVVHRRGAARTAAAEGAAQAAAGAHDGGPAAACRQVLLRRREPGIGNSTIDGCAEVFRRRAMMHDEFCGSGSGRVAERLRHDLPAIMRAAVRCIRQSSKARIRLPMRSSPL